MSELPTAGSARWPFAAAELRLYRGHLTCREPTLLLPRRATEPAREQLLSVRRVGAHALPGWGGRLEVARVAEGGVPLVMLAATQLRGREGSERFQAGAGRPPRSLKKQYQSVGVAAWERDGPLVYSGGGQLVFVPGLGLDARVVGVVGQAMVALAWIADRDPR